MSIRRLLPVLLAAAGCGGGAREATPRLERVLLAVTDATHAAHLSCYGNEEPITPVLDALAADGVRFARAFSNNTWTLASTGSLMTGLLQESHGAVTNAHRLPPEAVTLAEVFAEAGYETAAFVQMAYASGEFGMDQGFAEFAYYGESQQGKSGLTVPELQRWLDRRRGGRWFVYLHLRRPHSPYRPNDKVMAYVDRDCPLAGGARDAEFEFADLFEERELPPDELAHVRHLYAGNVSQADALLRSIVERAREQGALIAVTSDHGEAVGQHGAFGHGKWLWAESIDVPLILWWPGVAPAVDEGPACTVDVLPTLLDLCGLPAPKGVRLDGVSLADRARGLPAAPRDPVLVTARYAGDKHPKVGVVDGPWKLVRDPDGGVQLFHRLEDPRDLRDRSADEPEVVRRLGALAERWAATHARAAERGTLVDGVSPDVERDLDALGY